MYLPSTTQKPLCCTEVCFFSRVLRYTTKIGNDVAITTALYSFSLPLIRRRSDEGIQFVPMRDPRAVAVSTYYYARVHRPSHLIKNHYPAFDHTLDETVLDILESVCQWTAIRHLLFNGFMSNTSTVFLYEDAIANPSEWHYRWTHMAGLHLPTSWVKDMSVIAARSMSKGLNSHPGGVEQSVRRTWKEEVSPEIWDDMDGVLRQWLPPVLLARFGV